MRIPHAGMILILRACYFYLVSLSRWPRNPQEFLVYALTGCQTSYIWGFLFYPLVSKADATSRSFDRRLTSKCKHDETFRNRLKDAGRFEHFWDLICDRYPVDSKVSRQSNALMASLSHATAVSLSQSFCLVSATNFQQNIVQRCALECLCHFRIVDRVGDDGNRTPKNAFLQGLNQHR